MGMGVVPAPSKLMGKTIACSPAKLLPQDGRFPEKWWEGGRTEVQWGSGGES